MAITITVIAFLTVWNSLPQYVPAMTLAILFTMIGIEIRQALK